jgi:hypothetical protein
MNAGKLVPAPIVSSDNTSPEAILAREAKRIQAQAHADTKYDDKDIGSADNFTDFRLEQFINPSSYVDHRSRNLAYGALASAGFLGLVVFITRK